MAMWALVLVRMCFTFPYEAVGMAFETLLGCDPKPASIKFMKQRRRTHGPYCFFNSTAAAASGMGFANSIMGRARLGLAK